MVQNKKYKPEQLEKLSKACLECWLAKNEDQKLVRVGRNLGKVSSELYKRKELEEKQKIKANPYSGLAIQLNAIGEDRGIKFNRLTVFTNVDYDFPNTRFGFYLQDIGFRHHDEKMFRKPGLIQHYFKRGLAVNDEVNDYIQVQYFYTDNYDLPPYFDRISPDEPCTFVNKVVIEGTINAILPLYEKYWKSQSTVIGNKDDKVWSTSILLSDIITLKKIAPNKLQIIIENAGGGGTYGIRK